MEENISDEHNDAQRILIMILKYMSFAFSRQQVSSSLFRINPSTASQCKAGTLPVAVYGVQRVLIPLKLSDDNTD
jgi:hypothetical protein